jgi:hypothetical protein
MRPLSSLYLFPVFQTREEYLKSVGVPAPQFDPSRPVKSWFDPNAAASPRRTVVYDNALALASNGYPLSDEKGRPFLEPLLMTREHAATVNIPVKDFAGRIPETATVGFEVPVPCRDLKPGEVLTFGMGGLVYVVEESQNTTPTAFTVEDRQVLLAIAKKLGV